MTDVTNPIQINPVQPNPVQSPAPSEEKPAGSKISVKKIVLSLFIIIIICLLVPILVLFLNPFGILTNRINQAKTITTENKTSFDRLIDRVVLIPETFTQKFIPVKKPADSFLNREIKSYYENKDKPDQIKIIYSNQPELTTPQATDSGNVRGISTDSRGEVLAAVNQFYVQYMPMPGKANFSSNQFNGSASLSYPLNLPKGPGGFTPGVSLNYSSESVDALMQQTDTKKLQYFARQSGPVGLGWSLSAGEGSVNVDRHGSENPCSWNYKLSFSGGSAEFFKVDDNGNPITSCKDANTVSPEWLNSKKWRTNPELFLKIEQGWASDLFPGDSDFSFSRTRVGDAQVNNPGQDAREERFDIWKVTTPDGSEYVFGNGKQEHYSQRAQPQGDTYIFMIKGLNDSQINTWKQYRVKNLFGQKMIYRYNPVWNASALWVGEGNVSVSNLAGIEYGVNKIEFLYNQARKDTGLVKENGLYWAQNPYEYTYIAPYALSAIKVYSKTSQLLKTYELTYWDGNATGNGAWIDANSTEVGQPCGGFWDSAHPITYQVKGYYKINNDQNVQSYHLVLKSIKETTPSGASLPPQTFTYQKVDDIINMLDPSPPAGKSKGCWQITPKTVTNRNSIYIQTADNGFGGKTEYIFETARKADRIYLPEGTNFLDNGYDNPVFDYNTVIDDASKTAFYEKYERPFRQRGLRRARLQRIKVSDGLNNFNESYFDYGTAEPKTVLKQIGKSYAYVENTYDDDFVGYSGVTVYSGKKNLALNPGSINSWASKSKTYYHQILTSSGCAKKDPRAGSNYRSQGFDENGIISESVQYSRFKNWTDVTNNINSLPNPIGESCADIPPRPVVFQLKTDSITAKQGENVASLFDACTTTHPSYCNIIQTEVKNYDWDPTSNTNPEKNKFGALIKTESYLRKYESGSYVLNKLASSQINYLSQGYKYGDSSTYLLNKPYETWINNPVSDGKRYKWQRTYYDNQAFGILNGIGKNLTTKTETCLYENATCKIAGQSEILQYDSYGNALQVKDGQGNISKTSYDGTYNAYPKKSINALGQFSTTEYDFETSISATNPTNLGLPVSVTDINGLVSKSTYDALGWLKAVYKPGDTTPSAEFEYHLNENSLYGVPIAVMAKVRTEKGTTDEAKILKTYDLYDGLGNKVQSQSLIRNNNIDQFITSYADVDYTWNQNNPGVKTIASENYDTANFGKLNTTMVGTTTGTAKKSYAFANLSGQNWKSIDMNGNVSYSYSNPEDFTAKTVSPNGLIAYAAADPVARTQTGSVCKDIVSGYTPNDGTFLTDKFLRSCPVSGAKISTKTVSDFMGNTTYVYDNLGITSGGKPLTTNIYDSLGRLRTSNDADLGISNVVDFDLNGNILKTTNAAGTEFRTTYDALNRPFEKYVAGQLRNKFYYDQPYDGRICGTTSTATKGKLCKKEEWGNDPLSPSSQGNLILKYLKYDDLGRVLEERVNYGGTLASKFGGSDFVTSYTYDNIDRVLTVKYPDFAGSGIPPETVTNTYTGPYLSMVKGDKNYVNSLAYDYLGRLTKRSLNGGTVYPITEDYAYDVNRRLSQIQVTNVSKDQGTFKGVNLAYNNYDSATGNILGIMDNAIYANPLLSKTMNYKYDNLSRLVCADSSTNCNNPQFANAQNTYSYDDLNNLLNKKEDKNYAFAIDSNFPYHGVKKVTAGTTPGPGISYDNLGRMTSYTVPGGYQIDIPKADGFDLNSGKPQKIVYTNLAAMPTLASTPIPTVTKTPTPTATKTLTPTTTAAAQPTLTPTKTLTPTITKSPTPTITGQAVKSPTPTVTKTPTPTATGAAVKTPTPTTAQTQTGNILTLQPSPAVNNNLSLNTSLSPSAIMTKVRSTCSVTENSKLSYNTASTKYTYSVVVILGKTYSFNNFKIPTIPPNGIFSISYSGGKSNCQVSFPAALGIQVQAQTPSNAVTEVYYYDGEGSRIMKALVGSDGKLSNEVLYINQYLEKDRGGKLFRKNYYADGKLVAVRNFNYLDSEPAIPAITAVPTGQYNPISTITAGAYATAAPYRSPTPLPPGAATLTPTLPPGIYLNSGGNISTTVGGNGQFKSCTSVCNANNGKVCVSVGTDIYGSNGMLKTWDASNGGTGECFDGNNSGTPINCTDIITDKGGRPKACPDSGHLTNWTNCNCANPSPTVTPTKIPPTATPTKTPTPTPALVIEINDGTKATTCTTLCLNSTKAPGSSCISVGINAQANDRYMMTLGKDDIYGQCITYSDENLNCSSIMGNKFSMSKSCSNTLGETHIANWTKCKCQ